MHFLHVSAQIFQGSNFLFLLRVCYVKGGCFFSHFATCVLKGNIFDDHRLRYVRNSKKLFVAVWSQALTLMLASLIVCSCLRKNYFSLHFTQPQVCFKDMLYEDSLIRFYSLSNNLKHTSKIVLSWSHSSKLLSVMCVDFRWISVRYSGHK
jgi:hypothetical protein